MQQPRTLVEMNDLIGQAFLRAHGRNSPLEVPRWWADQVREVIRSLDPDNAMRAGWLWARLGRRQQQDLVLEHVGTTPRLLTTRWGLEWLKKIASSAR